MRTTIAFLTIINVGLKYLFNTKGGHEDKKQVFVIWDVGVWKLSKTVN